uniref:Chemosensory protein 9 n=1 Tax=Sclerodermus sp. MQW-2015 TaxID=1729718 RepID=A0A0N9K2G7_9HYME|nr:chemosensory protein 9 [Sclerodermus sp. MQW-2015]
MAQHLLLVLLVVLAVARCVFTAPEDTTTDNKYTTKYDQVDVDAIVRNERLVNSYVGCLLDRNSCTPDAAELKKNLPDALQTACVSCSEAQKDVADKFSQFLIDHKPDQWKLLEEKYDPDGEYKKRYLNDA